MKQTRKNKWKGDKTNCDLFHCEVQGRGLCNSSVKKGATQRHSQGQASASQPQQPLKAVPQAAGVTLPASSRNAFLPPLWGNLPADGAFDILAPLLQVPKGIQNSGCRAKLSRIKGKTLERKKKHKKTNPTASV